MMAFRIAFCKVHYPLEFYAAYFSVHAKAFDANVVARGKEYVHRSIQRLKRPSNENGWLGKNQAQS